MKAMILAAGRGERLRPLTERTAKPMLRVRGRPLLEHQLEWLKHAGFRDVVINVHHLGEQIEQHLGDGRRYGVRISYSRESELLDTGGGVVNALALLGDAPFLILNGDIFTDFSLRDLTPLPAGADVHLVVTPRPAFRAHGDLEVKDGWITGRGERYVYCGILILDPKILRGLTATPFSLREVFFRAIDAGRASAQVWSGYWTDIGTPGQLEAVNHA